MPAHKRTYHLCHQYQNFWSETTVIEQTALKYLLMFQLKAKDFKFEMVLTWLDVLVQDADVTIPVGATLFVVEAEGVEQLMLDGAVVQAALLVQRQGLGVTQTAHVWVTPACRQKKSITDNICFDLLSSCFDFCYPLSDMMFK